MKFSHSDFNQDPKSQDLKWQRYQQLEGIPTAIQNPYATAPRLTFGLGWLWRSLLSLLADELVEDRELQIEYLERCWTTNVFAPETPTRSLQKLWALMN